MGALDALPPPQRDALATAFGQQVGPSPSRFILSLATLSLLAASVDDRPLLCVVDDAQWLDSESAQVMSFVARRLTAQSIGMVCALRAPSEGLGFSRIPTMDLRGLDNTDSAALLASRVRGPVDVRALLRIVTETGGNPLAMIESARVLSHAELRTGFVARHLRGCPPTSNSPSPGDSLTCQQIAGSCC